jgi:hypothetical protein
MDIDIREISLTEEQQRRIAELAEQSGRPWREVLEEQIALPPGIDVPGFDDRYIRDKKKRLEYFREWVSRQTSHNPNFDDSRESIYP